jgi:cytochrome P450
MSNVLQTGPIVRYKPNALSFSTPTALHTIYGFGGNVQKSQFYSAFPMMPGAWNTHSSIDRAMHSRKRRVISHGFSDTALRGMEKYIVHNIQLFTDKIGMQSAKAWDEAHVPQKPASNGEWTQPKDMADWCNYLTFDVMGDLVFGKPFHMLSSEENHFAVDLLNKAAARHLTCGNWLPLHNYHLDKILLRKIALGRERYGAYGKQQLTERMNKGNADVDRKDFFYYLLNAKDPETGEGFPVREMWGESNLLIIAGSDTTSTALAGAFYYLTHHPRVLEKLTREVRETFGSVDEIVAGTKLSSCTYLRAVFDESMRLASPVGGILPREVLEGGLDIDGHHIPAGVDVGCSSYVIHHDAWSHPDPWSFTPERWIAGAKVNSSEVTADAVKKAKDAFCPFSIGPRGCIGKGLAYTEMSMALARIVWSYDMRLAPGTHVGDVGHGMFGDRVGRTREGEYQLKDTFTSHKEGPMVQFRARA